MSVSNKNPNKKRKRALFRIDMVIISCAIAFIACFAIYMKAGSLNDDGGNTEIKVNQSQSGNSADPSSSDRNNSSEPTSSIPDPAAVNPVPESAAVSLDYLNSCAFVGDSLTVGLASYQILPQKNVFASIGMNISKIDTEKMDTTYGKLTALEALIKAKPKNIYIMLGSNGIGWLSNDSMIGKYSGFIDEIKKNLPDSQINILSIPPVTVDRENLKESPIQNSRIDDYNSELLKLANSKNINFVDINTGLKNNQGKLDIERAQKDGMHFKKAAYDAMIQYIIKHVASAAKR